MVPDINSMAPITHQNCVASPPGNTGSATFMPHRPVNKIEMRVLLPEPEGPVSTVSGRKIVDITVKTFITVFRRLEIDDRCASRIPVMRSWNSDASSYSRTSWS